MIIIESTATSERRRRLRLRVLSGIIAKLARHSIDGGRPAAALASQTRSAIRLAVT